MKVLQINAVCGIGSTGRIAIDLAESLKKNNDLCIIAYGRDKKSTSEYALRVNSEFCSKYHSFLAHISDKHGFYSKYKTKKFLKWIEEYSPDLIHLHNLHGDYINIKLLFNYIKKSKIPIVWTFHDCWNMTGHCPYFTFVNCDKWKIKCHNCPQKNKYPSTWLFDNSKWNFDKKKELFCKIDKMAIVTPSKWLKNIVELSFMQNYPVSVINNGIDLDIFKPTKSNFRKQYSIGNKKIILGVANCWTKAKGYDDFIKLAKIINKTEYIIVMVGLNKSQLELLPRNIVGISRTNKLKNLVEIYSVAEVFLNLTYEDNFPTTNLEALACGTPVVTYDVGGSPESINEKCGCICEVGNINEIVHLIYNLNLNELDCIKQAQKYNKKNMYNAYLDLYNQILN